MQIYLTFYLQKIYLVSISIVKYYQIRFIFYFTMTALICRYLITISVWQDVTFHDIVHFHSFLVWPLVTRTSLLFIFAYFFQQSFIEPQLFKVHVTTLSLSPGIRSDRHWSESITASNIADLTLHVVSISQFLLDLGNLVILEIFSLFSSHFQLLVLFLFILIILINDHFNVMCIILKFNFSQFVLFLHLLV